MELQHFTHEHKLILNEKNNLDPDEGISSICFICSLPIFYTPYYSCSTVGCGDFFIHQRCAHIPERLKHVSGVDLTAKIGLDRFSDPLCIKCRGNCSHIAWKSEVGKWKKLSPSSQRITLKKDIFDAMCAAFLELRIFHGSHEHELIPMNTEEFTICGACGLRHENERGRSSTFYCCFWCNLRLHENCATLPSYIQHREHKDHPLGLTYALPRGDQFSYSCGICGDDITSLGIYFCGKCSYHAHVKCATHCSKHYQHVPSREIGDQSNNYWIQFPMEDEDTSLVSHILENMKLENHASSSSTGSDKHDHPLIFNATSVNPGRALICDGCVQPISSPYYSCSQCTDYLLHESCANLPQSIVHSTHEHPLSLKTNEGISGFYCRGCHFGCNGFSYSCSKCYNFELDVQCAFLPKSILHKAHDKRHVLRFISEYYKDAKCCDIQRRLIGFRYICTGFCCDFQIHAFCAGLPMFVRHKFDKHPLKLILGRASITSDRQDEINFCEFCEEEIDSKYWYYDCAECNNSIHVKCIPALGRNSKIKLRAGLKTPLHPHPLTTIRLLTTVSRNCRCGACKNEIPNFQDELAFECSECDATFHHSCALGEIFPFRWSPFFY